MRVEAGAGPNARGAGAVLEAVGVGCLSPGARMWRRVRRMALRATVTAPLAIGALALWTLWLDREPRFNARPASLPSPNAFQSFQRAAQGVAPDGEIDALAAMLPNVGWTDWRQWDTLLPRGSSPGLRVPTSRALPDVNRAGKVVAAHAEALRTLRGGFAHRYWEPMTAGVYENLAHLDGYRKLARLLALEGYVRDRRGRRDDALQSCLDAIRLGVMCQNGSPRLGRLVGLSCEAVGRAGLWSLANSLNADQARRVAIELQGIASAKPPIADMFDTDLTVGGRIIVSATDSPTWRFRGWGVFLDEPARRPGWLAAANYLSTLPGSRSGLLKRYERFVLAVRASAAQGYPKWRSEQQAGMFDFFGRLFLDDYSRVTLINDIDTAENELLAAHLASRAYRLRHGRYADSLSALMSKGYVRRTPWDPFSGKPLRYLLVLGRPVIYSVGPDARDNAGVPITEELVPSEDGGLTRITERSRGDIVATRNLGW